MWTYCTGVWLTLQYQRVCTGTFSSCVIFNITSPHFEHRPMTVPVSSRRYLTALSDDASALIFLFSGVLWKCISREVRGTSWHAFLSSLPNQLLFLMSLKAIFHLPISTGVEQPLTDINCVRNKDRPPEEEITCRHQLFRVSEVSFSITIRVKGHSRHFLSFPLL